LLSFNGVFQPTIQQVWQKENQPESAFRNFLPRETGFQKTQEIELMI
jgi:hypothetical protein